MRAASSRAPAPAARTTRAATPGRAITGTYAGGADGVAAGGANAVSWVPNAASGTGGRHLRIRCTRRGEPLAQRRLQELPHRRARDRVDELEPVRQPPAREL